MRNLWMPLIILLILTYIIGCTVVTNSLDTIKNNDGQSLSGLLLNITQPQDESVVRSNPVTVSGSITPGADVMVNGISISIDNSHFTAAVELEQGPNLIEVLARDSFGKQATRYISVIYIPK